MSETNSDPAKGSSRNIYAFGATSLLNDTASEMAYWVLPAFLASIGAGPAQLGIIEGIAESVASFAKLLSGYIADRIPRRKPIVVSGYGVANAVKPLLALTSSWRQVLAIRFAEWGCDAGCSDVHANWFFFMNWPTILTCLGLTLTTETLAR